MSVTIPTELTVQQNFWLGRYGQLTLAADGRRQQPTNLFPAGSAEAVALAEDNARATIVLDDASSAQNPAPVPYLDEEGTRRAGDTVSGLTGFVDVGPVSSSSAVRDYRLQPATAPDFTSSGRAGRTRPGGRHAPGRQLQRPQLLHRPRSHQRQPLPRRQHRRGVRAAEGQDRRGAGRAGRRRGRPDRDPEQRRRRSGPRRRPRRRDGARPLGPGARPVQGVGTDAIKVAQIYRTDRVERVGPSQSLPEPNAFTGIGRNPVAQTYRELATGAVTSLVVNHFKSKGSCPAAGAPDAAGNTDAGDGQGCWNAARVAQAEALAGFVTAVQAASGDPDVLSVGDSTPTARRTRSAPSRRRGWSTCCSARSARTRTATSSTGCPAGSTTRSPPRRWPTRSPARPSGTSTPTSRR